MESTELIMKELATIHPEIVYKTQDTFTPFQRKRVSILDPTFRRALFSKRKTNIAIIVLILLCIAVSVGMYLKKVSLSVGAPLLAIYAVALAAIGVFIVRPHVKYVMAAFRV